jgi:hypothetical protein
MIMTMMMMIVVYMYIYVYIYIYIYGERQTYVLNRPYTYSEGNKIVIKIAEVSQMIKKFPDVKDTESLLPCEEGLVNSPCPESDESNSPIYNIHLTSGLILRFNASILIP